MEILNFNLKDFPEEYIDLPESSTGEFIPIARTLDGKMFRINLARLAQEIGIESLGINPIGFTGLVLPSLDNEGNPVETGDWVFLTSGETYTNIGGGNPITAPSGSFSIGWFDGTKYVLRVLGTITVPPVSESDVAKYAYTKSQYVPHILVDNAISNTTRINDVDVTDPVIKLELLKKLDQAIKSLRVFGLTQGEYIAIRQFTFDPNGNFSIGLVRLSNEKDDINTNAMTNIGFTSGAFDYSKPFRVDFRERYNTVSYIALMDMTPFQGQKVSFNFRNAQGFQSYKTSGLKFSGINLIPYKSFWNLKYDLRNSNVPNYPESYYFHEALKGWKIKSKENALVRIQGVNFNATNNVYQVIITTCADDDPNNLVVDNTRNKFGFLRINIDASLSGIKRINSFSLNAQIDIEIEAVFDITYLNNMIYDRASSNVNIDGSTSLNAHWIVSATATGGGGGETVNSLDIIGGEADFENLGFRLTASNNWVLDSSYNTSKFSLIPEGCETLEITALLNGSDSNLVIYDKNHKIVSKAYTGTGTTNSVTIAKPVNGKFVRLFSTSSKATAKVVAKGQMLIDKEIKEYRSIHEGLGDKFGSKIFRVNGLMFEKNFEGLCTLEEYETVSSDWLEDVPEYEVDGDLIIPSNIPYTGNNGTYTGGSLVEIKNGVYYFYNAKACAIFKGILNEDGSFTYTTLIDKFNTVDVWDVQDLNNEGRSVIVALPDGELLIQIRHRGDIFYQDETVTRRERFFVLYRTTNGQTGVEKCITFSHEDTIRDWLPVGNAQRNWANHSGGCMLGQFTHYIYKNIVFITEYGAGTSNYWQHQGVANNGRGISGRAWVSFDYGKAGTWKKCFDADRKKSGTSEDTNNWYYFTSFYSAKMRHMHGCHIDEVRGIAHLTNGDWEDYDWNISLEDLEAWYNTATAIDPNEKPSYKTSDTFPDWEAELLSPGDGNSSYLYSAMKYQMMQGCPVKIGTFWIHDASREFSYISYYDINGEYVFEPVRSFERRSDYDDDQSFVNSWVSTDGFGQHLVKYDGVYYSTHNNGTTRPSRILATKNGIDFKTVFEGANDYIKFATLFLKDGDKAYLNMGMRGQDSTTTGFWKLKVK